MNGTKARRLRRQTMPFFITLELREYHRLPDGSIKLSGFRRAYKDAKRAERRCNKS